MITKKDIWRLRYKVIYVPHKIIKDHIACYNVEYKGEIISSPAARRLKIPLGEIWISRKYKKYEKFILFHEPQEIKYRCKDYDRRLAHVLARIDETLLYKDKGK